MANIVKATLFDFDDTLMATRNSRVVALTQSLEDFGYHVSNRQIDKHWGKPFDQLIASLAPGINYNLFYKHYKEVMLGVPPKIQPGVVKLLQRLHSRKIPVFVISSGSNGLVMQDLERGGIARYISRIWGFEDTEYHKPDPRVLMPIIAALVSRKITSLSVVYFGDSLSDYYVARANGIRFIAVLTGKHTRKDFRKNGLDDDLIFRSMVELTKHMDRIFR